MNFALSFMMLIGMAFVKLGCTHVNEQHFKSTNGWFELDYPAHWTQFDDEDGTYLFMDDEDWKGNLRITAMQYKDKNGTVQAEKTKAGLQTELAKQSGSVLARIGQFEAVHWVKEVVQEGDSLCMYNWTIDGGGTLFICSFTIDKDKASNPKVVQELDFAEQTLASIKVLN